MKILAGSLVDIRIVVLPAGERAPQVPEDTQKVDLELKVKGRLLEEAEIGAEVEIETPIGRRMRGRLEAANPAYTHHFGAPIPELSSVGRELRALLADEEARG